ncbi:MAG TPA: family 43 glycosylhydrolase [Bryobacteraceae bacterium]|jgi:pectate lyase|nr:family 43 glycosylhydrolase [Bryobacteraceae bacterium]
MNLALRSILLLATLLPAIAATPAFPGAEGFGSQTPGGRGGKILIVRNLNDSGPGSFREAVSTKGARIVVFRVGGLITLASPVKITEPFLTVAGQTAPGDGICFRGNEVSISTHDVIVRYLRFRPGDISHGEPDGLNIVGDSHDVIVDHVSASWSIDEALSPSGGIRNITVQWSIIAEGLNRSIHSKGPHGYGSLVRAIGGVTLHHNLWAHNDARNPRLGDNYGKPPFPTFDVRNNVMYDYGATCSGLTGDRLDANYVANYIRPGPSSNTKRGIITMTDTASLAYFIQGNVVEGRPELTADNVRLFDRTEFNGRKLFTVAAKPFDAPEVRTTTAEQALRDILASAGATLPRRDSVDARIVREVETRTGSIIDSQAEVGSWPEYRSGRPPVDSDNDGIPDDWEIAHRLNPHDPTDASVVRDASGYSYIELYINNLRMATPPPPIASAADPVLFAYFRDNGQTGVYFALSDDGYHYEPLKNGAPWLPPEHPGELMRDPFIARGPDGTFHMVWTWEWRVKTIGHATSRDLVTWSKQQEIPLMSNVPGTANTWAAEIYWVAAKSKWMLVWSSAVEGKHKGNRIYSSLTADFKEFTPPAIFFDPGYEVIDATILHAHDRYWMIFKDERTEPLHKELKIAQSASPEGPWSSITPPITEAWSEGPSILEIAGKYVIFFDHYKDPKRYQAIVSTDLEKWSSIQDQIRFPDGARHGSFLKLTVDEARRLRSVPR